MYYPFFLAQVVITCCPPGYQRFTSIWRPLRRTRHQPRPLWSWQVLDSPHACKKCQPSEYYMYLNNDNLNYCGCIQLVFIQLISARNIAVFQFGDFMDLIWLICWSSLILDNSYTVSYAFYFYICQQSKYTGFTINLLTCITKKLTAVKNEQHETSFASISLLISLLVVLMYRILLRYHYYCNYESKFVIQCTCVLTDQFFH